MTRLKTWVTALAIAMGALPAWAVSGEAVAVVQQAVLAADGSQVTLTEGAPVALGDTIATGETGEAQIIFPDETRIVVGPNSQLTITRLLFRENGTARRLSVNAVRGTFRFLSGESPPNAYAIRTPTATMGVRGTEFDFAVVGREDTDLVVYNGEVRMCGRGRCASVPGGCQAVRLNRNGNFSQPETAEERAATLAARFPYAEDQERLRPVFRTSTVNCRDGASGTVPLRQISLPAPARAASQGGGTAPQIEEPRTGNPAD